MRNFCKIIFTIIFDIVFSYFSFSQNTWLRSESSSQLEVGDLAITNDNEYFLSLKNNHHIFNSNDSGITWKEVSINNGINRNYLTIDKPFLKLVDNKVYCVSCAGGNKRYRYNGYSFEVMPNYSNIPRENLIVNQEGRVFYKDVISINDADSSWSRLFNKIIYQAKPNFGVIEANFYTENNNYFIISNFTDSMYVYKVITNEKNDISLYSRFKTSKGVSNSFVSKGGVIYFMSNDGLNRVFNYVSSKKLDIIRTSSLQERFNIQNIYYNFINANGEIFIISDKGIFVNNGIDEDQWIKCYQMSNQLPKPPANTVNRILAFNARYFFKDSMNALISYGDNCGQSEYFCFSPKYKEWKTILLDVHIDNLVNLVKNKNNRLFAYRPCENYLGRNYLQSDNNGKDWVSALIYGEHVTSIGINKDGEAIAIATNNKIYLHNSSVDSWNEVQSPVSSTNNIIFLHLYASNNELFLTGSLENSSRSNYLFHSADGGQNWQEIKAFVKISAHPRNDFQILVEHKNNWIAYSVDGQFNSYDILVSTDSGRTWLPDSRFKNFAAASIKQLPNNKFLLSGTYNLTMDGTYIIDSVGNFSIYASQYEKNPAIFSFDQNNRVFGYPFYYGSPRPFTSSDLGLKIVYDDSGILPIDQEYRYIRSSIYENKDNITLNLAYDGIYTNTHDIFNNISDKSKTLSNYSVLQDSEWIYVDKKDNVSWNNQERIQIINLLGQVIIVRDIGSIGGRISTRTLAPGVYLLQLQNGDIKSQVIKFLVK